MSETSADITNTARTIASSIGFLDYDERENVTKYIDHAIRTERERCAKIAEEAVYQINGYDFAVEYREEIAVLIRGKG